MEEGVSFFYSFPRARYPLSEGSSSQEEIMEVSPSIDDQDLMSLIDEEEKAGDDNAVIKMALQAPHEDEFGALSPRE